MTIVVTPKLKEFLSANEQSQKRSCPKVVVPKIYLVDGGRSVGTWFHIVGSV